MISAGPPLLTSHGSAIMMSDGRIQRVSAQFRQSGSDAQVPCALADVLTGEEPGRILKIYLLLIDHSRFFFYSDESEASDDADDR